MSGPASGVDPLAQLADEFLERHRRGERPALTEYTARHPELAEQIRALFPALHPKVGRSGPRRTPARARHLGHDLLEPLEGAHVAVAGGRRLEA